MWRIAALVLVFGQAGASLAQSQPVFGPVSVTLPNTNVFSYANTFTTSSSTTGPYLLRVQLSAPNSLTTLNFKLNNVQVMSLADFAGGATQVDKVVTVLTSNSVSLQIAGKKGTVITISVFGTPNLPKPTSLAPDPLSITAGASGNLTATLSPAPTTSGTLSVSSANAGVATVPASVAFAANQTQVVIPVSGVSPGSAIVTATLNGGSASATVNVTPAPPTVTSLAPASLSVVQGATGTLTVTISAAQTTDTAIAISSGNSAIASVASSVLVPAGQVSASINVSGVSPGTVSITAALNGSSASSQVTVTPAPPTVVSLLPVTATVTLGASTTLRLTISSAQTTDTAVAVAAAPAGIVSAPASVTVPAGATGADVTVGTLAYGQAGVTASLNGSSASSVINVVPPPVQVTAIVPATFTMKVGATSQFTVQINAAQTAGTDVALAVDNPGVLTIPASVTVAAGQTSAIFTATGVSVGNAIITASANNTQATASVHVSPQDAAIVSLLPNPLPLQQGATGSLTALINVAQEVDTTITLTDDAPGIASVAATAIVPAGAVSVIVPVTAVAPGTANITASVNGTSATAAVTVSPPPPVVNSITPATLTLPKGTPGTLRVTVTRAPSVATAVTLSSSAPAIASVPPTVNIPAGALLADFPVASNDVGQATITASLNGGSATATVTITPAELVTLTLSPQAPAVYVGDTEQFSATGTMTDGTSQDFAARATWSSSDPGIATINATGLATPLAAGTTVIAASYTFVAAATGQSTTITSSTQLTAKQPVPLVLTAPATTLLSGSSTTVTVTSTDPAPAGGLTVTLSATGSGTATFPATVQIPELGTSATFTVTGNAGGTVTIVASAPHRLSGSIDFTILQLAITSFTPASGPVGTAVAINGIGFDPNLSNNQVAFNGEPAVIASGTATLLNVIVPPRATTGPITVTNALGTATSATPFTIQEREAFDLALAPSAIQAALGGTGATKVSLVSTGLNPYPYAASVTVTGLPPGVTVALDRPSVFLNGDVIATFATQAQVPAGTYPITFSATGQARLGAVTVTKTLSLTVLAAGATTVTGRVLHADDGSPFVGARIRLGAESVFTDETGTYRFVSPTLVGDQVLLIDGNFANSPTAEYPSGIAMPVMIVAGQDNKVLTSFIQAVDPTKFTTITPGAAASVTNADLPNFSLNIPAGATLVGWDGTPITKINVRTVTPDRLPIRPIPDGLAPKNVYLYYFFREGGATPTQPIPVTMANDQDALPGEQVDLYYYDESATPDPNSNQWRTMGTGTVSPDGKSVVSDPGVGIPKFCCGASFWIRKIGGGTGPNGGDGCPPQKQSDNPVDLASGNALVFRPRLFGLSALMPVNLNCQYRSTDTRTGMFGVGMSFTYDWFANVVGTDAVQVINPAGVQFMLSREADGVFRAHSGRSAAIEMEVTPTATGRTLRLADKTSYEFDFSGFLIAVVDQNGNRTTFQNNGFGFPEKVTDAAGQVYTIDVNGKPELVRRITDPQGRFVSFTYDASNRLASYTDQGGGVTSFEYGPNGRISKKTDPRGGVEAFEYDNLNRVTKETMPDGSVEQFSYNAVATTILETKYTDGNGNVTTYRWNGLGFASQVTDALGQVTKYTLDPVTNLVRKIVDPAGRVTSYTYNQRGDMIQVVDALGNQTLIDYDLRFRKPIRIENALHNVVTMTYDDNGNLTSSTDAELHTTTFTYTAEGQLASVTDALNRTSRFAYDASGNLISTTNAVGETSSRAYDLANRLIQAVDPLQRTTKFSYDSLDRVVQIQDAASGLRKFTYDANDNLLSVVDPKGNPVERSTYDLMNRLKQKADATNLSKNYVYDGAGNMISMTVRKGQITTYAYDVLNRIVLIQDNVGRTTGYTYDLLGNITRISDSQSGDILMSYDSLNRLTEVVTPQGTIDYAYDAIGRRASRTVLGGDVTSYAYDKANRVISIVQRNKTATYVYDAAGRLSNKTLPDGIQVAYAYDDADRITSITYSNVDGTPIDTVSYAYDVAGQRVQKTLGGSALQETPISATYDAANRLTQVTINGETFDLNYDANGSLESKIGPISGTTSYSWDARNRLAQIVTPNGMATFKYDALGRRIESAVDGTTIGFLYDGAQAVGELTGNAVDVTYHLGLELDEVLARYTTLGNKSLVTDSLQSVIAQANEDQSIGNFYVYSPYGESSALGPDQNNSLQYTGRENDRTGLYYYRARYYDPVLKRFIAEDPIGIAGGLNLYAYVNANPIGLVDPLGLTGNGGPFPPPNSNASGSPILICQFGPPKRRGPDSDPDLPDLPPDVRCDNPNASNASKRDKCWCEYQERQVKCVGSRNTSVAGICLQMAYADLIQCFGNTIPR
ncbi:MAG TPA: RHS repeat-associated core domain-containing protein [Burkholderiales bacterium]|nr:RHS repeat-associated core domain-containing protein [Burkholderiales bacterium]